MLVMPFLKCVIIGGRSVRISDVGGWVDGEKVRSRTNVIHFPSHLYPPT
jgi:hypothetical protein